VIALNSGTAALHASLTACDVGKGDEVILPSFTFVSTANVVVACGGRPVFADIRKDYNIDPDDVKRKITRRTKAIIPVHLYGYPADMDELREIARRRSVRVIEDAAESLGAEYRGKQTGSLSNAGCFSLYATKVVTSGEGGAVSTNEDEIAQRIRIIRNHGMVEGYDTRVLGYNFRMTEISAAVASAQMDKLSRFIQRRRENASFLTDQLRGLRGATLTQTSEDRTHVWYLYTLRIYKNRDKVLDRLRSRAIGASVYFKTPLHKTPFYRNLGYSKLRLRVTEDSASHVISVPVHPGLTEDEREYEAKELKEALREFT
jgi:dTDP-4-amino-4,6-dideoxygalactose transaminase